MISKFNEATLQKNFAGSVIDSRSTTGYYAFMEGSLVTWRSKKQKVVSLSSAEVEYMSVGTWSYGSYMVPRHIGRT